MQSKLEKLIKLVYKRWKSDNYQMQKSHPDEEMLACFIENRLSPEENEAIKLHLLNCDSCAQSFAAHFRLNNVPDKQVPQELIARIKNLSGQEEKASILEIFLKVKEKTIELLNTTGDILVGQELVPAPILRSRQIKDFKDEVTVLKDFQDIRVELKVENKGGKNFNLHIIVKQKQTQKLIKDLRIALLKEDLELESYLTDSGVVTFEHVLLGKYRIEISSLEERLASILLDIKI